MATGPAKLPPFPANSPPGSWVWTDWWKKLQDYINSITNVAQQGAIPNATTTGITGSTGDANVNWVVIGNYCQFDIDIPVSGADIVAASSYITLTGIPPNIGMPPIVGNGLLYCAAYNVDGDPGPPAGQPFVQNLGIGYITNYSGVLTAFLPNFTVAGTGLGAVYENIHITGRYNVS